MYKIEIKVRAQAHLRKAALWYNTQQKGLGLRFLYEVEISLEVLNINPFYAVRYKDVRAYPLKDFPFLMMFRVDETKMSISILAVFHTSKAPEKYPK